MVAPRPGVELQHQPVIHAHGGHLDEHLSAEALRVAWFRLPGEDPREQLFRFTQRQVRGGRRGVSVVGRGGAAATNRLVGPKGVEVALPRRGVRTGEPPPAR